MAEKSKKHEANAQFAKVQRAQDAQKATSEYEAAALALRAKTEKLKALRLARDAAALGRAVRGRGLVPLPSALRGRRLHP